MGLPRRDGAELNRPSLVQEGDGGKGRARLFNGSSAHDRAATPASAAFSHGPANNSPQCIKAGTGRAGRLGVRGRTQRFRSPPFDVLIALMQLCLRAIIMELLK